MSEVDDSKGNDARGAIFGMLSDISKDHEPEHVISAMSACTASALGRYLALDDGESEMTGLIEEFSKAFEKVALAAYSEARAELKKVEKPDEL